MSTEVKHGPKPAFVHQITGTGYSVTLVGHYTAEEGVTAGGVTEFRHESNQDEKRRNELLGLRSIFLEWWIGEWLAHGGEFQNGVSQIQRYPFSESCGTPRCFSG